MIFKNITAVSVDEGNKNLSIIFPITFILAFCSIVYELLLAQSLSAFLENTVLRYSITIGLYMFSMGCGALLMEKRYTKHPVVTLLKIETALTAIGGFAVVLLHLLNMAGLSRLAFAAAAHGVIIIVGILTGTEIPLLIEIRNIEREGSENTILGIDYTGAFLGTVLFAFLFYPETGLVPTAFLIGFLNSAAGLLLYTQAKKVDETCKREYYISLTVQAFLSVILVICIIKSKDISQYFISQYLR